MSFELMKEEGVIASQEKWYPLKGSLFIFLKINNFYAKTGSDPKITNFGCELEK